MITVVYCTRETNPEHKQHLIRTSGLGNKLEVIEIINNGESLTKAYNRGLAQAKNSIVVFCHDDITITTKDWGEKLFKHYIKTNYGILGVAGTKYLSESGRWWDKKNKMIGRVSHQKDGNTWLSEYSQSLGDGIEEVCVVDGVFFSLCKERIVANFNENYEGYHFYDISFCFQNYLEGVDIGVHTDIHIIHRSMGITNDAWEENRLKFVEEYKDELPVNLPTNFSKTNKLNVLMACLSFKNLTGSELYTFELAKELIKLDCNVTVCSEIGEPMASLAHKHGIKMTSIKQPPGYMLGDGKWEMNGEHGREVSKEGNLYRIGDVNFHIMHLNHKPIAEHFLKLYPNLDAIETIHSEVISLEEPVIAPQIKRYIAIRPEIKNMLINKYNINEDNIDVIYNPINTEKFKQVITKKNNKKVILFVGTIDYLRKNTILDLIKTTKNNNEELWLIGANNDNYLYEVLNGEDHVKYIPTTSNVEKYTRQCDETAGILLGRTTIEGWLCGKAGWIYDIDSAGNIKSKTLHPVPDNVQKFDSKLIAKEIFKQYKKIINL